MVVLSCVYRGRRVGWRSDVMVVTCWWCVDVLRSSVVPRVVRCGCGCDAMRYARRSSATVLLRVGVDEREPSLSCVCV